VSKRGQRQPQGSRKRGSRKPVAKPRVGSKLPTKAALTKLFSVIGEASRLEREAYKSFVQGIWNQPTVQRAESWLVYITDHPKDWGDQEALVYLRSRGQSCSAQIEELVRKWKDAEAEAIKRCAEGISTWAFKGKKLRKVETTHAMSLEEASNVRKVSPVWLPDFWSGTDYQQFTIDATMLRTVEWCEIGGFKDWWLRLSQEVTTNLFRGGIEPVPASYWLFNYCRSDYARQLMSSALEITLQAIEIGDHNDEAPWRVLHATMQGRELNAQHGYASTLLFANAILRTPSARNHPLIERAGDALLKAQRPDGAWSAWAADSEPSIDTTAMAIHGLALVRPHGWQRAVQLAEQWLLNAQKPDGFWEEHATPDVVYLTVLVLDAINLARGESELTFTVPSGRSQGPHSTRKSNPRFLVALSFPGEIRPKVKQIADGLLKKLGTGRVLYDKYLMPELARPDLDVYLQGLYGNDSLLIVPFLSADYSRKEWPGLEWRAIRQIIKEKRGEQVMPVRLDDTEIPGLFPTDGYINFFDHSASELVALIIERVRMTEKQD
jgi:hypothetical protein